MDMHDVGSEVADRALRCTPRGVQEADQRATTFPAAKDLVRHRPAVRQRLVRIIGVSVSSHAHAVHDFLHRQPRIMRSDDEQVVAEALLAAGEREQERAGRVAVPSREAVCHQQDPHGIART
jgi:hypothetical protein